MQAFSLAGFLLPILLPAFNNIDRPLSDRLNSATRCHAAIMQL
jgi:hypothetical protein